MRAASAVALTAAASGCAAVRVVMVGSLRSARSAEGSGGVRAGRAEAAEVDGDQFAGAVAVGLARRGRRGDVGRGRVDDGGFAGRRGQLGVLALADAGLGLAVGEDLAEVAADGVGVHARAVAVA